jgi:glycine/D-amino acid oxidase-like deaminating enzyme
MPALRLGRPLWLDRQQTATRQAHPSLRGQLDVDVVIVGGGLTGATVAAVFAGAGVRVAVLEAELAGLGSTSASTALLLREPDVTLTELGRRYGPRKARRIWQLSVDATRDFVRTLRQLHIDCDLAERDSIYYTLEGKQLRRLQHELERRRREGFDGDWLSASSLKDLTGIDGEGAIRSRHNAQFNPYKACVGLLRSATGAGAAVFERSRVRRITHENGSVRIGTRSGTVRAAAVVIATGYAAPPFQPPVGRFRLHQTYVLATKPIDGDHRRQFGREPAMVWDTERPYHYARWTTDRRLLLGGADREFVSERRRHAAFTRGTGELYDYFRRLFPLLSSVGIERAWDGLFATTPDGLPYIGRHSRFPRRLFALGYGGNGMTFGFLAARMLLEQWREMDSPDHALFGFGRFR